MEPAGCGRIGLVARVATDALITARAKRILALPRQDNDADAFIFPGEIEGF